MGKHIEEHERYKIESWLKDGISPCQIAAMLGRHFTTIYKEIKKGLVTFLDGHDWVYYTQYCADVAQRVTQERQSAKGPDLKVGNDHALAGYIEHLIKDEHYSPYAVSIDLKKRDFSVTLSAGTIYNYIDMGLFLGISNKDLYSKKNPRKKSHKSTRPALRNKRDCKSIEERPKHVSDRSEYGHWEMDTVYSGKDTSKACLLVLTERMTREEYALKMSDRTIESTVRAIDKLEHVLGLDGFRERFKTITCDNGSEFKDPERLECSSIMPGMKRTAVYFCHPGSSCERASNENANKLVRHWIPKGDDIGKYSDLQVKEIQDWINDYPRKLFGGLSVNEYKASLGID